MIRTLVSVLFLVALVGFAAYSEVRQWTLASRQAQIQAEKEERLERTAQESRDQSALSTINNNLLTAAGRGNTENVKLLLESGVDVNARDTNGDTPLIAAAFMGFDETIHLLLDHGADVNAQNNAGNTALMEAAVMNRPETVALLIAGGANREAKNLADLSAADLARRENHFQISKLLESGVIPEATRRSPFVALDTDLQKAAEEGDVSKIKELLAGGANVNTTNKAGWTPLMRASVRGQTDVLAVLLANGADVNRTESQKGRTAMILAAVEGHADIVAALLKAGANLNAKDRTGETAMSVVMQSGNNHIGRLLKSAGAKTPLYNQVVPPPRN